MKVLKALKSGLICYEDFDTDSINAKLNVNANYVRGDSYIDISGGSIYMNVFLYTNLVFEIDNNFVPANASEVGGISITRSQDTRELYEYYDELNSGGVIEFVKVVKNDTVYTGYSSEDEIVWQDKGYVVFPNAETIGVSVTSDTPYRLNSIKVYTSEFVNIYSLLPGWRVDVYKGGLLLAQAYSIGTVASVKLPYYPFTGTFKVYDDSGAEITNYIMTNVWGGDEYTCTADVDLCLPDGTSLHYDISQHLGTLQGGKIETDYIARNNSSEDTVVTIRVAEYSLFGDWVSLAEDKGDAPGIYSSSITINVPAMSDMPFWILVQRPDNGRNVKDFNFQKTECLFYLEVV